MANCLFAIQGQDDSGAFANHPRAIQLIRAFERDVLRKLYLRTIRVLGVIDHISQVTTGYLAGDFYERDFSELDFYIGYLDTRNNSYSSTFQTIVNIFRELCNRSGEISYEDQVALNDVLIPVLDAFDELQDYLTSIGLNVCTIREDQYINNSPEVFLQVAGSDGTDGIAAGWHLRWSLLGELGSNHLPRGDYDNGNENLSGFNKANDYVYLSRIPYLNPVPVEINFETSRPVINFSNKTWTYLVNQTVNDVEITNRVRLTFIDAARYNDIAVNVDPVNNYYDFLNQYNGLLELEVLDKTAFRVGLEFYKAAAGDAAVLKIEATCQASTTETSADAVYVRKRFAPYSTQPERTEILADNIRTIRLSKTPLGYLRVFYFETYHDFVITRAAEDWTAVGNGFGLSTVDAVVYDRLENDNYPIDHLWPLYNEGTTVRISNYRDKWNTNTPNELSLKSAVTKYLSLSESDSRAEDVIRDETGDPEAPGLLVSYLDMLEIQAMDYHVARMLGLGHIDLPEDEVEGGRYVYRLNYTNKKSLQDDLLQERHYITLPIGKGDRLLPETPKIRPVSYGLPVSDGQDRTMFDTEGYTTMDQVRAVNIGRQPYPDEIPGYNFFTDPSVTVDHNIFLRPEAVLIGVEYRADAQIGYVKPEITHEQSVGKEYYAYDIDFPETGVLEPVPVPDDPTSIYLHFERQTGVHCYALYAINWFSRASEISEEASTDVTAFPLRNTLAPPTDVTVQYIQKEDTRIFTTATEQYWLNGREEAFPDQDVSFTRTTFNWVDILDVSALQQVTAAELRRLAKPDKVRAFFKQGLPLEVTGLITDVAAVSGSETLVRLRIGSYLLMDGTVVTPSFEAPGFHSFIDSQLTTTAGQFRVLEISEDEDGKFIIIEKAFDTNIVDDEVEPGNYGSNKAYISPERNSRFSMVENLSKAENWDAIAEEISLLSFADPENPVIEITTDSEGNVHKLWLGGMTADVYVTAVTNDPVTQDEMPPGYYMIAFEESLTPHPQVNVPFDAEDPDKNSPSALRTAHVEWYKGKVMVPQADAAESKLLEVAMITQLSPLVLFAYDPTYQENPIATSDDEEDRVRVNFHPGYRAYLFPEPAPQYVFNALNILPAIDDNDRKSLFGLQAIDTRSAGTGFASEVATPVVLLARSIEEPVQFDAPMVPGLKVRPDATGKAALTFDIKVLPATNGVFRTPFGFMFYRTSLQEVLYAFYKPETVAQIEADLAALTEDPSADLRAYQLVNLIFDPAHFLHFNVFEASPEPYGFPVPDRLGLVGPGDDDDVKLMKYKAAIQQTLLPLTEQPPLFRFIKPGFQTENTLPVIRDIDGNMLSFEDERFNPFPMVRSFRKVGESWTTFIRFTDYTLSGASRNLYFYAGAEVTSQLVIGDLSWFTGPVTVLHTMASAAPLLRKFSIPLAQAGATPSVVFDIAPISPEDHISRIRVYRTLDASRAAQAQSMEGSFDISIEEGGLGGYELTDTFADMEKAPAGKTIYYRFAGVRVILNEDDVAEDVLSEFSEPVTVRLIDTSNPAAPALSYDAPANALEWLPTTDEGTYFLFKQNVRGNWERIFTVNPPYSDGEMAYTFPQPLPVADEDGNRIYHRFKVQVQNVSGLFNLSEKEITI